MIGHAFEDLAEHTGVGILEHEGGRMGPGSLALPETVNPRILGEGRSEAETLGKSVTRVPDINVSKDAGGTGRGNLAKYGSRAAGTVAVAGIGAGTAIYTSQSLMSRVDADLASAGHKVMQIPSELLEAAEALMHGVPHPTLPTGLPSFGGAWTGSLTTVILVGVGAFVLYEGVRLFS